MAVLQAGVHVSMQKIKLYELSLWFIISSFQIRLLLLYIICVFNYLKYGCTPKWSTLIPGNNKVAWNTFSSILAGSIKLCCVIIKWYKTTKSNIVSSLVIYSCSKLYDCAPSWSTLTPSSMQKIKNKIVWANFVICYIKFPD